MMIVCLECGSLMVMDCHYDNERRIKYQCPECGYVHVVEVDYHE